MTSDYDLIAKNDVFAALPTTRLEDVSRAAIARQYSQGETIVEAGQIWPYLLLVKTGAIQARKYSLEGRSLVVTTFSRGDIFWGLAFFYPQRSMPVSLVAAEATRLLLWPAERLQPVLIENGQFAWELARLMIDKMARANEILEEMAFQPVAGRLARLLAESGQQVNAGVVLRSLTLDEMAARIGSTREVVCRFLHRFADDGIIDITRTEYRIVDPTRLQELMVRSIKG